MHVQRILQEGLIELIKQFPVVGIIGPRQVGKTTLVKRLINHIEKECLYLDLELPEDQNKLHDPQLFLEQHFDKLVILDEIQRIPDLFPLLRALIDRHRVPGRYIILGSASPDLLKQSSESLAGRIAYKEVAPFNYTEIINHADLNSHWFKGGFPEVFLAGDEGFYQNWMTNFVRTYLERDLPGLGLPASPPLVRRLWTMLAHFHGGIWNASNFSKSLGITIPTVNKYLDFLESAFLISRLQPFHVNLKKRLVKSPKIYIRDSGVLHYLTGIPNFQDLQARVLVGNSWEGYVIEQIRHILPDHIKLYYYRTHNGAESDLVLVRGTTPISCIETKYTAAPKVGKGFQISTADLHTEQNFIITPKSDSYPVSTNIIVCSLHIFLMEHINSIRS
jgi:predicted AAA+ superfamily ATPase